MKNLYSRTVFSIFSSPKSNRRTTRITRIFLAATFILSASFAQAQTTQLSDYFRVNLFLRNSSNNMVLADGIMAEFNTPFSDSIKFEDAVKFTNINENIGIQRHGVTLSVERRPIITQTDTLFLRLWKTTQREYQLEFVPTRLDHPGLQAFLQDTYLHTSSPVSLTSNSRLTFNVDAAASSAIPDRFRIVFNLASPVPVTLTNVSATLVNDTDVDVEWKVENEVSMLKYEVEKSLDGSNFTTAKTTPVSGVNNLSNTYNWLDQHAVAGTNFYRIKLYDMNGRFRYSNIVKVEIESKFTNIVVYPNPVRNNVIGVQMGAQPAGLYYFRLINTAGQTVYKTSNQMANANGNISLKPATKIGAGVYYLEIRNASKAITVKRVIVE